jgi:hypothetical protein
VKDMAKHEIEIIIEPGGIVKSEVHGILGNGCETECKWLDNLGKLVEHKKTADSKKTKKVALVKKVNV